MAFKSRKNKYLNRSHISEGKFRKVLKCFCDDFTAVQTTEITGVGKKTVNRIFNKIRERLLTLTEPGDKFSGEVEIDESYFGARRVRGKRGRGAKGKFPVFGLLKRDGKVSVAIVKNCQRKALLPIIKGKILEDSVIYSDGWKSYDSLVLNGYRHYRIYHSKNEFARGKNHINGIESFWSWAKRRLNKFNGLYKNRYLLHLKECEWRWNHKGANMYQLLRRILRENPL